MSDTSQASSTNEATASLSASEEKSGLSRRTFIKIGVVAGAGLTLGISYRVLSGPGLPESDATFAPNAFLRIDEDGTITVMVGQSEMGQGVATALPQLVAEELDVDWDQVTFELAPAHSAYGLAAGMQMTGGSTSVVQAWRPLREAGAKARWMLREAAARRWGVAAEDVTTRSGTAVAPDGSVLAYGELAADAATLEVPDEVPLKQPSEFHTIGQSAPRLDVPAKVTGEAVFGIDAGPEDTRVALVARPPVFGSRLQSFDASATLALPGVDEVVELEGGVAVVADGYVNAKAGRDALVIEWDTGSEPLLDDDMIFELLATAVRDGGRTVTDDGDVEAAFASSEPDVSVTYRLPYLAHATMEPMNCTAWVRDGRCTVWAPTQFQSGPGFIGGGARQVAAKAAGVSTDDTQLHTTFLGGGFGRRAERDFVQEAAELAGKVEGPVKVIWSREDDMQHDFYRPASHHEMSASIGPDGLPSAWDHRMASQSIMQRLVPGWVPGSPTPPGASPLGTSTTSTSGISFMRSMR